MKKPSKIYLYIIPLLMITVGCKKDATNTEPQNPDKTIVYVDGGFYRYDVLKVVNEYRAKGCKCGDEDMPPVPSLIWNDTVAKAALRHSIDMAANNTLSHDGSDGSNAKSRIDDAGYEGHYTKYGENILNITSHATDLISAQAMVNMWLNSPPHCKNIMNPNYKKLGIAGAVTPDNQTQYYTQDFTN